MGSGVGFGMMWYQTSGVGTFSPLDVPNLYLWLDATDPKYIWTDTASTTYATNIGQEVASVTDKSGNSRKFTRASVTGPTFQNYNGLKRLDFSGSVRLDSYTLSLAQPMTVFIKGNFRGASGRVLFDDPDGNGPVFLIGGVGAPLNKYDLYAGVDLIPSTTIDTLQHVYTLVINGASSAIRMDSTELIAGNAGTNGQLVFRLGANWQASPDYNYNGDISQFLVYNAVVSDENRAKIENYLLRLPNQSTITQNYYKANFKGNGANEFLQMYGSTDGKHFVQYSTNYTPNVGTVRDPNLYFDGTTYWMVHTNGAFTDHTTFTVAKSTDLIAWTHVTNVDLSGTIPTVNRVWGPKWFKDTNDSLYVLVSTSTNGGSGPFTHWITYPTNAEMTTWSAVVQISGLPANTIDGQVVKNGSTYTIWFKNETTKYVEYSSSSALRTGYSITGSDDWAGWGNELEGNWLIDLGTGTWRIYLDKYTGAGVGYYYSESTDNWATWSAKTFTIPSTLRNGSVTKR